MNYLKTTLVTAASAMAIAAATPAFAADDTRATTPAQRSQDDTRATTPAQRSQDDTRATRSVQGSTEMQIKADELVGKNVENVGGESVGEVESVIIDQSGKVAAVIVGVGGFLGIGEREVAIDWNDLVVRDNGDVIQTRMNREQLTGLPQYRYAKPDYRRSAFVDPAYVGDRMEATTKNEWVDAHGLKASKLLGSNVVNAQGETIGEVEDLIVTDGQTMLILSVGEFLGMGGHDVAVGLDKAKILQQRGDADDLRVSINMNKDQLKGLPKYDSATWNQR